ncbi:hypothetical protein AVEN_190414-1 [Araneus ventricosus]|uniref:Uncharacterized protein n=1 Tax=Araneus ventricosus TaxID=182803 RepID=A0A4Y2LD19_ARAVE|nr:hypothetical protein AVEN_190414-1 [Araneus ventricosus]
MLFQEHFSVTWNKNKGWAVRPTEFSKVSFVWLMETSQRKFCKQQEVRSDEDLVCGCHSSHVLAYHFYLCTAELDLGQRWPSGKVSASGPEGFRFET